MPTLSYASTETKQLLKWAGIFFASLFALYIAFNILIFIKNIIFPPQAPKPQIAFGKLQQQVFPQNAEDRNFTYSINTLTGKLPGFDAAEKVYRMETVKPDLLALSNFDQKVQAVGFSQGYSGVTDKVFEWKSTSLLSPLERRIRINIVNDSFSIDSPYTSDADVLAAKNLPNAQTAIKTAQDMLERMQMLPTDIDASKTKTNLFSIQNNSLSLATSLSSAQIVEVNFFQNDVNKLPIYYEKPDSSNIRILVGGGSYQGQIVAASYVHQKVSGESSTYPLKTSSEALDQLKQGGGYIAQYRGNSPNVTIENVILAYYIGGQDQDFLMPIFVFAGSNNFLAYVPAVKDEWIEN